MELNIIETKINNIKKGTFRRLTYKTELPLKATYKKAGFKIIKVSEITTRFGINYGNLKAVKAVEKSTTDTQRVNNYTWYIPNYIQFNTKTQGMYICTYPVHNRTYTKSTYIVVDSSGNEITTNSLKDYKDMIINSYFNKSSSGANMLKININNIIDM